VSSPSQEDGNKGAFFAERQGECKVGGRLAGHLTWRRAGKGAHKRKKLSNGKGMGYGGLEECPGGGGKGMELNFREGDAG